MRVDPFYMLKTLPNMAAAHLCMRHQAKAHSNTITTACAAATQAMGEALEVIRRGDADVMLTGGTEAGICELGLAAFSVMKVLSTRNDEPREGQPPVRREARWLRLLRGRGDLRVRGARARPGARRAHPRRGDRLRRERGRVPHGRAVRRRRRRGALHAARAGRRGHRAGGDRLRQRARHIDAAQRLVGDGRDQGGARRARVPDAGQLHASR